MKIRLEHVGERLKLQWAQKKCPRAFTICCERAVDKSCLINANEKRDKQLPARADTVGRATIGRY